MDSRIIDGAALARVHEERLRQNLKLIKNTKKLLRNPAIVSFCNEEDPASVKYTYMKLKKAEGLGIDFIAEPYSKQTSKAYLGDLIDKYNQDLSIDGIMLQLPLPDELKVFKQDLINKILPRKDVDGLTQKGRKIYLPATVKAVLSILNENIDGWRKMSIALVGSKGEVGKLLFEMLNKEGVKDLIGVDKNFGSIIQIKNTDIVISATGEEGLISGNMVKDGVIAIDVGLGDFDPSVYDKASAFTPIKGGVGPMTVVSLMENVLAASQNFAF